MFNFPKKLMLMGVGLITTTQKKAEELTTELIKEGSLSKKEGEKFVKELLSRGKEEQEALTKMLETTVKKMNIPTLKDLERLEQKVDKLLSFLEKK